MHFIKYQEIKDLYEYDQAIKVNSCQIKILIPVSNCSTHLMRETISAVIVAGPVELGTNQITAFHLIEFLMCNIVAKYGFFTKGGVTYYCVIILPEFSLYHMPG